MSDDERRYPKYQTSDQLLAQMPELLRMYFANRKIERPKTLEAPGIGTLWGGYYPGSGRVEVSQDAPDSGTTLHELLHALQFEHPHYQDEQPLGFPRLREALGGSPYNAGVDYPHLFTDNGITAATDPEKLGLAVQNYFSPILPPVNQLRRGPR